MGTINQVQFETLGESAYALYQGDMGLDRASISDLANTIDGAFDALDNIDGPDGVISEQAIFNTEYHGESFSRKFSSLFGEFSQYKGFVQTMENGLYGMLGETDRIQNISVEDRPHQAGSSSSTPYLAFVPMVGLDVVEITTAGEAVAEGFAARGLLTEAAAGSAVVPFALGGAVGGMIINPDEAYWGPRYEKPPVLNGGEGEGWGRTNSGTVHEDPAYPDALKPIIVEPTPKNEEVALIENRSISMMADRGPKPKPPAGSEGAEVTFNESTGFWECDGKYYAGGKWHSTMTQARLAQLMAGRRVAPSAPVESEYGLKTVDAANAAYALKAADAVNAFVERGYGLKEGALATEDQITAARAEFYVWGGKIYRSSDDSLVTSARLDFIIMLDGTVYIGHGHAALSANAERVACAGAMNVNNEGIVWNGDNQSGHYRPSLSTEAEQEAYKNALEPMIKLGVFTENTPIVDITKK